MSPLAGIVVEMCHEMIGNPSYDCIEIRELEVKKEKEKENVLPGKGIDLRQRSKVPRKYHSSQLCYGGGGGGGGVAN